MDPNDILRNITPEIVERFKTAVERGKWPDGSVLSKQQQQTCLQAIIVYEQKYVAPAERTGYLPKKETPCEDKAAEETVKWK